MNSVGVELNTASASLLGYVAGIGPTLAKRIVQHRDANGPFRSRRQVLDVSGLGPKTFEQSAGFLRIRDGEHPLDESAVHPERYARRRAHGEGPRRRARDPRGQRLARVAKVQWQKYAQGDVGEFTLRDIVEELKKPGRDPRAEFEPPKFRDDVRTMEDLKPNMQLEGVVTNVTAFGAFVDIGVHQDGLVHVSQLSDRFIKDPAEVVRPGDRIKVRVLEVDLVRKRISLTAKSGGGATGNVAGASGRPQPQQPPQRDDRRGNRGPQPPPKPAPQAQFKNNAFERLLKK